MGTTPIFAIPYVEPTDALATYPAADKAQADKLEASLGGKPFCVVWAGSAQSQVNGGETAIVFSNSVMSQPGMFTNGGTTITFPVAGLYEIVYTYSWVIGSGAGAKIVVPKYGGNVYGQPWASINVGGSAISGTVTYTRNMIAGATIAFSQYQSSGAVLNTNNQAYPSISVARIGPHALA